MGRLNAIADELGILPMVAVYYTAADAESLDSRFNSLRYADFLDRSRQPPDESVAWHDPASIVYTSGTTGKPKGVVLPHRWIFGNYIYPSQPIEEGVTHCSLPLYHVGGLYAGAVSALASGGAVALWNRFSPADF